MSNNQLQPYRQQLENINPSAWDIVRNFAINYGYGQAVQFANALLEEGRQQLPELIENTRRWLTQNQNDPQWIQGYMNTLNTPGALDHIQTPQDLVRHTNEQRISPIQSSSQRTLNFDTPLSKRQRTENMNSEPAAPMNQLLRTSGVSTTNNSSGSAETPITPADPRYSDQTTDTCKMPVSIWCTVVRPQHQTPVEIVLKMTTPLNVFSASNYIVSVAGAASTSGSVGNYNKNDTTNFSNWDSPMPIYPVLLGATPIVSAYEFTQMAKKYNFYTVLNCHYKLTFQNVSTGTNDDVVVRTGFNTYSTTTIGTKYPTTNIFLYEERCWKNMKEQVIRSRPSPTCNDQGHVIIEGDYKPGQAERSVMNDGDVKRWTAVGVQPTFTEEMVLRFYRAPFAQTAQAGVRCELGLCYTVQFKDLKPAFRYPNTAATPITQTTVDLRYTYT
jgi:hypothetical protein